MTDLIGPGPCRLCGSMPHAEGCALDWLVRLKDGPRDDAYRTAKPHARERARAALSATDPGSGI